MLEPHETGDKIAGHLKNVSSKECAGKFYEREEEKSAHNMIKNNEVKFRELIKFSEKLKGIKWK